MIIESLFSLRASVVYSYFIALCIERLIYFFIYCFCRKQQLHWEQWLDTSDNIIFYILTAYFTKDINMYKL